MDEGISMAPYSKGATALSDASVGADVRYPNILVVDDNAANLLAMEGILAPLGYRTVMVQSAARALASLLQEEFAVILMDVQMPGMDGFEAAQAIKSHPRTRDIPIIFVTAISREASQVFRGYSLGAVDYLLKPFDPEILRARVSVFVDLYRKEDKIKKQAALLQKHEMRVGILGHDLRNPLSTIQMGAQLLQNAVSDEGQLRIVRRMKSATDRMTRMVEQLLDLTRARLGSGLGLAGARSSVNVADLVQRVIEELQTGGPDEEIVVATSSDCVIAGDPDRLLQLFSNLVGNALRHRTPGTPVAVRIDDSGSEVSVDVQNAGVIPPDVLPVIFDPFRTTASSAGGLGLGLFIAHEIAIAHGGTLSVHSSERTGTTLTTRLPRTEGKDTAQPAVE